MFYFIVNIFRPAKLYSDLQKTPVQNRTTAHIVLRTVVLVDPSRLELETTEPKSAVLPLHHGSMERGKDNNISRQSKIACSTFLQCYVLCRLPRAGDQFGHQRGDPFRGRSLYVSDISDGRFYRIYQIDGSSSFHIMH